MTRTTRTPGAPTEAGETQTDPAVVDTTAGASVGIVADTGADTGPPAAETAPPEISPVIAAGVDEEVAEKKWEDGAIVVAGGDVPEKARRPVIVVQTSEREDSPGEDARFRDVETPALKSKTYGDGGDVYLRLGTEADMGKGRNVVTVGGNIEQAGTEGLSDRPNQVHVGPASPTYAAINLAYNYGARKVEVLGATDAEKDQLAPWLEKIADKVDVTFG